MSLIAIDFDHTINNNLDIAEGERYSKPFPEAKESIQKLMEAGHKIMIFSCNRTAWIKEWLNHYEIPFDYIWEGMKPVCDAYIDDRGVGFRGDWTKTLEDVDNLFSMKSPWEKK